MNRTILSPMEYIQGQDELKRLKKHARDLKSKKPMIIVDSNLKFIIDNVVSNISSFKFDLFLFSGESSIKNIKNISNECISNKNDLIIGIGGGKIADTSKAVSDNLNLKTIICPTSASTNASCSRLSVIYYSNGKFNKYMKLTNNPDKIIVDTNIIINSPLRLLISGIGDALATYFETSAAVERSLLDPEFKKISQAANVIAKCCHETLIQKSAKAIEDFKSKKLTNDLEDVIEANIYLSAIGSESGSLAAAHSIHNGLTKAFDTSSYMHGEIVAVGIIVQMFLEGYKTKFIKNFIKFYKEIGLPTTIDFLDLKYKERIDQMVKYATHEHETIHNMPFKIRNNEVRNAIVKTIKLMNK